MVALLLLNCLAIVAIDQYFTWPNDIQARLADSHGRIIWIIGSTSTDPSEKIFKLKMEPDGPVLLETADLETMPDGSMVKIMAAIDEEKLFYSNGRRDCYSYLGNNSSFYHQVPSDLFFIKKGDFPGYLCGMFRDGHAVYFKYDFSWGVPFTNRGAVDSVRVKITCADIDQETHNVMIGGGLRLIENGPDLSLFAKAAGLSGGSKYNLIVSQSNYVIAVLGNGYYLTVGGYPYFVYLYRYNQGYDPYLPIKRLGMTSVYRDDDYPIKFKKGSSVEEFYIGYITEIFRVWLVDNNQSSDDVEDEVIYDTDDRSNFVIELENKGDELWGYYRKGIFVRKFNEENRKESSKEIDKKLENSKEKQAIQLKKLTDLSYSLSLKENEHFEINIYNAKGQKVRDLDNRTFTPGRHQIVWDGKNNSGQLAATGVYFMKLDNKKGESILRKILLLK